MSELKKGEGYYRVNVRKMNFNRGHLRPVKGDIIILGPGDANIPALIRSGAVTPVKPKEAKDGKASRKDQ